VVNPAKMAAFADLVEDSEFWRFQARSLAVFATPGATITYRLPNRLVSAVEVSDRFHVKPLLRALTFPQVAFVLMLAQGSVRLIEVAPDVTPGPVDVPDLPRDVASFVGKASIRDRSPSGRLQGVEGQTVRMRQYARGVDRALRPVLGAAGVPLILAATEPLDSIYRSVSTYPLLATTGLAGNAERRSDAELASEARAVLDELNAAALNDVRDLSKSWAETPCLFSMCVRKAVARSGEREATWTYRTTITQGPWRHAQLGGDREQPPPLP
jgi:hypothetical protein